MDKPQRLARRQEQKSADFYGGRLVAASGSGDAKGDIITGTELIECKHTERQSFGLRRLDFFQHARNALLANRRPVWEIEYTDPDGRHPQYVICLDRDDYKAMRDRIAELEDALLQTTLTGKH